MHDSEIKLLWAFVRSDLLAKDFEIWLYNNTELEKNVGADLYLELISLDYGCANEIYKIKSRITDYLNTNYKSDCSCITLSDIDIVAMGSEFYESLANIKTYGHPREWLHLNQCPLCKQYWLTAYESICDDNIYLKRLNDAEAQKIIEQNEWPNCFATMGELIGIANKHDCRMSCEENDIMLPYIIAKVAEGKAGITVSELSVLLRLQYESTKKVSRIAVAEYGVDIDFQDVI